MSLPDKKCTGCGACFNACPKRAITMKENNDGFLYPFVKTEVCIKCGICEKVCPAINPPSFYTEANTVYVGWNKDVEARLDCSSGGIFDSLARTILSKNGVVYGAAWDEEVTDLKHIRVCNEEELVKLRKSKYQQSNTGEVFSWIKNDLRANRLVLFSGTPCQVAGLKKIVNDIDMKNLYTVEILCHGVPSKKVIDNYLRMMEVKNHKEIVRLHFRYKDDKHPWRVSCCCCCCSDGTVIFDESTPDSFFWTGFLGNVFLRESCSSCDYAKNERGADITLGDFWGIWEDDSFHFDYKKGVSLIILNSEKGIDLLEASKNRVEIHNANKRLAYEHNLSLTRPSAASSKRDYFFANLGRIRYDRLIKKCFRQKYLSLKIKSILGENISNKVSLILHR